MRLDKYLKVARIIKRRTLAKEVADQGRITINDAVAKASGDVKVGDVLSIRFGNKLVTIKVKEVRENAKKEEAAEMYEVISEKRLSDEEITQ